MRSIIGRWAITTIVAGHAGVIEVTAVNRQPMCAEKGVYFGGLG
jgi:hypothetical protein